jgi:hypothetical protein
MTALVLTLTTLLVLLSVAGWGLNWPGRVMVGLLCAAVLLLVWVCSDVLQHAARPPRSETLPHSWALHDWPRRDTQPVVALWGRARSAERGSGSVAYGVTTRE